MCETCDAVRRAFAAAQARPLESLAPVHRLLADLLQSGRLTLYAGDCPFGDMLRVLEEEKHFTVCCYLRCPACGTLYFFGACIRGVPVYQVVEDPARERIEARLWGRVGAYFG